MPPGHTPDGGRAASPVGGDVTAFAPQPTGSAPNVRLNVQEAGASCMIVRV